MRLTRYSDFSLRVLLYLAARGDRLCSISEMASAYGISHNHLMKVLHDLGKAGYVSAARGRMGGFRLARPASEIQVGALLRHTEDDFDLVDCPGCALSAGCGVSPVLDEAMVAFFAVLDGYTLADIIERRHGFHRLILSLAPADRGSAAGLS
ncbi:Rrf2 family transcriptional regulator [Ancylobacter dichloromethanicus]|uniref:HTH-type transcriptional regulator NsrR n=1 Tax=Ancylobacter dichloromethanicus TaxID=518825 RepID=A0A9W6J7T9_9HYPH|nr:Rrf2 family transcriptional regulator [Ancylobacter dichloromethanicus]MBS7555892.1 Rrf2 family transcriptional regulator [Ancylobacter dichloromethanicus]GLK72435.1 HTH-type transcriptional regulator NsrR [Ancylobacter dichloromethanicus]